ncbi:nuclear transport factor 2 family protein [Granulicoccus phenolivorans]|uniref:nuclear transport factor 2 family protein n=1 Tax=Granulicoccus phenolivorans TaxID=266854 RepID=UPI00040FA53B|nr:nuclear transport factor 2 family protein [Granulicoccus phenolivorans]
MSEQFPSRDAVATTVKEYLERLEAGRLTEVAELFTEDCFYSHPPYETGGPLAEAQGREDLQRLLVERRRTRGWYHEIDELWIAEDRCILSTTVYETKGGPMRSSSFGLGTFAPDGRIKRWVAVRSIPGIGSSLGG